MNVIKTYSSHIKKWELKQLTWLTDQQGSYCRKHWKVWSKCQETVPAHWSILLCIRDNQEPKLGCTLQSYWALYHSIKHIITKRWTHRLWRLWKIDGALNSKEDGHIDRKQTTVLSSHITTATPSGPWLLELQKRRQRANWLTLAFAAGADWHSK